MNYRFLHRGALVLATTFAIGLTSRSAFSQEEVVVSTTAELVAALQPANAGKRIRVLPGTYTVSAPLEVPEGATLAGDGVMLYDTDGLPMGIDPDTQPLLLHTAVTAGDILRLSDGSRVSGLVIQEAALTPPIPASSGPTAGNPIAVTTRKVGDRISTSIEEVEIINPNPSGVGGQHGPTRRAIMIYTRNPNQGAAPSPETDSALTVRVSRTIIRSPRGGSGIFAINFAARGSIRLFLEGNVIAGGLDTSGGVTLGTTPDNLTSDSVTEIFSRGNLYRDDLTANTTGINASGCSGSPLDGPLDVLSNSLRLHSVNDRIVNFNNGLFVVGGRRTFTGLSSGSPRGCTAELQLQGTYVQARNRGFRFYGALATVPGAPGSDNELRILMRGVTNNSARPNLITDQGFYVPLGTPGYPITDNYYPSLPNYPWFAGPGNRLELIGNLPSYESTNDAGLPLPSEDLFGNDEGNDE